MDQAQALLAEALRLGETVESAAAILAHSLAIALEDLARAQAEVSHGFIRAKARDKTT